MEMKFSKQMLFFFGYYTYMGMESFKKNVVFFWLLDLYGSRLIWVWITYRDFFAQTQSLQYQEKCRAGIFSLTLKVSSTGENFSAENFLLKLKVSSTGKNPSTGNFLSNSKSPLPRNSQYRKFLLTLKVSSTDKNPKNS